MQAGPVQATEARGLFVIAAQILSYRTEAFVDRKQLAHQEKFVGARDTRARLSTPSPQGVLRCRHVVGGICGSKV